MSNLQISSKVSNAWHPVSICSLCRRRLGDVLQPKALQRAIPNHSVRPTHILKAVARPQESHRVASSFVAVVWAEMDVVVVVVEVAAVVATSPVAR